jgi:peptidoglycan hydrolase-like protein with peptidoglycan-binding domain
MYDVRSGGAAPSNQPAPEGAPNVGKQTVVNPDAGGHDALGKKEEKVAPYFKDMAEIANALAPQFKAVGLTFRAEILLATVLQEAENANPVDGISFDGGMGLTQITPYNGKLDPPVAKAIGWDNSQSVEYNLQHSKWDQAKANLVAGAHVLLGKAQAIRGGVPKTWAAMTEQQRWRATLFAYNAGQLTAIRALEAGGPDARMISRFTYHGKTISHDYTAELNAKLSYVDSHDPFSRGSETAVASTGGTPAPSAPSTPSGPSTGDRAPTGGVAPASGGATPTTAGAAAKPTTPAGWRAAPSLAEVAANHAVIQMGMAGASVTFVQQHVGVAVDGEFGPHTETAVRTFQGDHELDPDGVVGAKTLAAMRSKQPSSGSPSSTPVASKDPTGGAPVTGGGTHDGGGAHGGGAHGGGSGAKGKPPAGGNAVAIASHFVGLPSWSAKLREGIRGNGWAYNNDGRVTNNCAEFVSSCLRMAGEISFQDATVLGLEARLKSAGWKYRASAKDAKPGDVWIHEYNPQHTVLVATAGGGETVGSDGSATEIIKREPMPYPGARYMYR